MKENEIRLAPQIYTYEFDGRKEWGFFELGKLKTLVHAENDPDLKVCDLYRLDPRRITNLQPFSVFGKEVEVTKVTKNKYGKYSNEIDKILEKITNFSLDDRSRLAAADAYAATLQRYHGWLVSNTFSLALMLVPSREAFFEKLGCDGGAPATREAVGAYCAAFRGVLDGVQAFLQANDLDDPTKV